MPCPRCQHENRPPAKFCEECTSPLASPTARSYADPKSEVEDGGATVYRQADRPRDDLCRPGGHCHRECSPPSGAAGPDPRAGAVGRGIEGAGRRRADRQLHARSPDCAHHHCKSRRRALRDERRRDLRVRRGPPGVPATGQLPDRGRARRSAPGEANPSGRRRHRPGRTAGGSGRGARYAGRSRTPDHAAGPLDLEPARVPLDSRRSAPPRPTRHISCLVRGTGCGL
jgi:hypothetical protein